MINNRSVLLLLAAVTVIAASSVLAGDSQGTPDTVSFSDLQTMIEDNSHAIGDVQEELSLQSMSMETGTESFPRFTGTACQVGVFAHSFPSIPNVYVSINHTRHQPPTTHDPVTVWIEDISRDRFRVCVREVAADNSHDAHIDVDWLAIR